MSLASFAQEHSIEQFLISFTDICGVMRSKLVPAVAIEAAEKDGAGFAGFAAYLDMTPADPDIFAIPDAERAVVLPWKKTVAWVPGDLYQEGKPLAQAPRNVLKKVIANADAQGVVMKTGVECEFFLLDPYECTPSDPRDQRAKPCYDQQVLFRHYEVINRLSKYMQQLGWNPYQADHEDANGQFEMNWDYADCLTTADRHNFFKFMVHSVAEEEGFHTTFMPKPFTHLTGNGCHVHMSLWDNQGKNLFQEKGGELGLSEIAYQFLGGIMHSGRALTAISNPTVNSYKRLHAATTNSGATWTPNTLTYAGNNRTHMVRIPDDTRIELRLPDGAANPYLLQAAILAAGLDGMEHARSPGKRQDTNNYDVVKKAKLLPFTLKESLQDLQKSTVLTSYLGQEMIDAFIHLKEQEWADYAKHISHWEVEYYKDV